MPEGNIQFDTPGDDFSRPTQAVGSSGTDLTSRLISWGLAKDRQQAQYVMLAIAACAIILAFFVYKWSSPSAPAVLPTVPDMAVPSDL